MSIDVKILADSINGNPGPRVTTWQLSFPKFILPQFLTHRQFSRNAQSSRALPTKKLIKMVEEDPVRPIKWGKNQRGMVAFEEYGEEDFQYLEGWWDGIRDTVVAKIEDVIDNGYKLHKQIVNRLIEPFAHVNVIMTTSFHEHFFNLRCAHDAQPEIQELALVMRAALQDSIPSIREGSDWHIPLVTDEERAEIDQDTLIKISTGRCARVSYLTHDGVRDIEKDIALHDRLLQDGHWSPFEHCAYPSLCKGQLHANLRGWIPYRNILKPGGAGDGFVRLTENGWEYVDTL